MLAHAPGRRTYLLGRYPGIARMMQFDWSPPVTTGDFWEKFPRTPVGQPVSRHLQVAFAADTPPRPGSYEIEVDLIYEGVFWFGCGMRTTVLVT